MRKVTVSRMRERYAQTVLTFRITYAQRPFRDKDYYTGQKNLTFFGPRSSIGKLSGTFYAEFRYVYRIFLSGRVSKIQRAVFVQNSTLHTNETVRNLPLKCRDLWFSPVIGFRCPAIVCQHTWGPLALVPLFHSQKCLGEIFHRVRPWLRRDLLKKKSPSGTPKSGFSDSYCTPQLCTKSTVPAQHPVSSLLCDFLRSPCKSS